MSAKPISIRPVSAGKIQERRTRAGRFKPGTSGNPAGRPRGSRNEASRVAQALLDANAEALTQKAIDLALEGNTLALKLLIERIVAPVKERVLDALDLPKLDHPERINAAMRRVIEALAAGEITPGEAGTLAGLIEKHAAVNKDALLDARFRV